MKFVTLINLTIVCVSLLCKQSLSLICEGGATAKTLFVTVDDWKESQCKNSSNVCLKIEAVYNIMGGFVSGKTVYAWEKIKLPTFDLLIFHHLFVVSFGMLKNCEEAHKSTCF